MKKLTLAALFIAGTLSATSAMAAGTAAGTKITNTATATYDVGSSTGITKDASVELTVEELINVNVTAASSSVASNAGDTDQAMSFTITNTGNGSEDFVVNATNITVGDNFDADNVRIFKDVNGDGKFDAGDTPITSGSSLTLAADASTKIIVLVDTPASATTAGNKAKVQLEVKSNTTDAGGTSAGDLTAGTKITGKGTGGAADAIVGNSAKADAIISLVIDDPSAQNSIEITKTIINIKDPFGADDANDVEVPGSVITYQIVVKAKVALTNVVITDPIKPQMTYTPGSITLDGPGQTDAADADKAKFEANTVTVNLGSMAQNATHTITLQAEIK